MFEDSTFESMGRIRTRSRRWMVAALAINGSILLALILIPLIFPEALPRIGILQPMEAPPPAQPPRPPTPPAHAVVVERQTSGAPIFAPPLIPTTIPPPGPVEVLDDTAVASVRLEPSGPVGADNPIGHAAPQPVARPAPTGPLRISDEVEAGLLIYKRVPVYPPIAIAMRREGTVVLQATISKSGAIENLRVVSGPAVLQQAALDAVKSWRYRPYQLDGDPIEVETTVNVVFTLGR
jgi:protein TonB